MRPVVPLVLVLALFLTPWTALVTASHDEATLPLLAGRDPVDRGLAWVTTEHVEANGCVTGAYDDVCNNANTKWVTLAAAHAGQDPGAWPEEATSLLGYLLDHAEDLEEGAEEGCGNPCTEEVLSLAKSTLAFRAAGQDPTALPLPGGGTRDLVGELLATFDGNQFGRLEAVSDDIWALLALNSVGSTDDAVDGAIGHIKAAQRPGGGVPWNLASSSASIDNTAAAVMAMVPHDQETFLGNARGFLEAHQLEDGPSPGCWPHQPQALGTPPATAESTAWALQAITALGEDPLAWEAGGDHPVACLLSFQTEDGGFTHTPGGSANLLATYQALAALGWVPFGHLEAPLSPDERTVTTRVGEETTLGVEEGFLRVGDETHPSYTWTPTSPGTLTFHGFQWEPEPRPVAVAVTIQEAEEGDGAPGSPPTVTLQAPPTGERNVSTAVQLEATAGSAPVVAFRVTWGDGSATDWTPAASLEHTYASLGEATVTAWAKDADGRVSDPTTATITIQDAEPRLEITGPEQVERHTPTLWSAEAWDPDGPTPTVTWQTPDGNATGPEVEISFAEPGWHELTATAQDAVGQETQAHHRLHAVNQAPNVTAIGPQTAQANTTITPTARTTDADDGNLTLAWRIDGQPLDGTQPRLDAGAPGNRTLQVNVTDPHGAWALAETTLQVLPEDAEGSAPTPAPLEVERSHVVGEPAPGASGAAPAEPAVVHLPATVTGRAGQPTLLDGTADQPGGEVRAVEVHLGGTVETRGTERFQAHLPPLPTGTYELRARALGTGDAWGPWTTATLVIHEPLEASGVDPGKPAPGPGDEDPATTSGLAPGLLLAGLTLAGLLRRRGPR